MSIVFSMGESQSRLREEEEEFIVIHHPDCLFKPNHYPLLTLIVSIVFIARILYCCRMGNDKRRSRSAESVRSRKDLETQHRSPCSDFQSTGFCPKGVRCQFQHNYGRINTLQHIAAVQDACIGYQFEISKKLQTLHDDIRTMNRNIETLMAQQGLESLQLSDADGKKDPRTTFQKIKQQSYSRSRTPLSTPSNSRPSTPLNTQAPLDINHQMYDIQGSQYSISRFEFNPAGASQWPQTSTPYVQNQIPYYFGPSPNYCDSRAGIHNMNLIPDTISDHPPPQN